MYAQWFFGSRLTVEGNVTIRTNAAEEQLNATSVLDLLFVGDALRFQICCVAVQDIDGWCGLMQG